MSSVPATALPASYSFYHRRSLRIYNLWVLAFNCRYVWRCPKAYLERLFLDHASEHHCDIGIGTGYFLEQVQRSRPFSSVHLVDGSTDCIDWVRPRLNCANVTSQCADVVEDNLEPPAGPVDSVSANFLLHCLRGPLERKRRLFANARQIASPGAVIFGSTIVGAGGDHGVAARHLLRYFNSIGVFDTADDSHQAIQSLLADEIDGLHTSLVGSVLIFRGTLR